MHGRACLLLGAGCACLRLPARRHRHTGCLLTRSRRVRSLASRRLGGCATRRRAPWPPPRAAWPRARAWCRRAPARRGSPAWRGCGCRRSAGLSCQRLATTPTASAARPFRSRRRATCLTRAPARRRSSAAPRRRAQEPRRSLRCCCAAWQPLPRRAPRRGSACWRCAASPSRTWPPGSSPPPRRSPARATKSVRRLPRHPPASPLTGVLFLSFPSPRSEPGRASHSPRGAGGGGSRRTGDAAGSGGAFRAAAVPGSGGAALRVRGGPVHARQPAHHRINAHPHQGATPKPGCFCVLCIIDATSKLTLPRDAAAD